MSQINSNHDPVPFADLPDRLMDCALAEMIGGETPPDLTSRILDRSEADPSRKSDDSKSVDWSQSDGLLLATAAAISLIARHCLSVLDERMENQPASQATNSIGH